MRNSTQVSNKYGTEVCNVESIAPGIVLVMLCMRPCDIELTIMESKPAVPLDSKKYYTCFFVENLAPDLRFHYAFDRALLCKNIGF